MSTSSPSRRQFGDLHLEIVQGDITAQKADAIVNAANNHFWMGSGVAGAIRRRGGEEIEAEAVRLGPVEPGRSVTTSAGRLDCRYVIHAAVMDQDMLTDAGIIASATASALAEADRLKLNSIAFPALGTGVGGFPVAECARLMIDATLAHHRRHEYPSSVTFVLFDSVAATAFRTALSAAPES